MNTKAPHSALREWRAHMSQPARITALLGSAVVLTLVAPFETDTAMRPLPRLAYWLTLVLSSYCAGYAASLLAARMAPLSLPRRMAIASAAIAPQTAMTKRAAAQNAALIFPRSRRPGSCPDKQW